MIATQIATIERGDVEVLRGQFRGALLRPAEEGYDEARRIWNGAIDRYPALIARCAGADDVVTAVRFAREHDLLVSVRGGGHAVAGHAVCDGGLMIDLSLMKAIRVDPVAGTVRAAGGVLWSELDRATQQFGLATTGGIISHTGIGGSDARRRSRPSHAQARSDSGQPPLRRPGDGGRRADARRRGK